MLIQLVREILDFLGKCQGILETSCCGNHILHVHVVMPLHVHHYSECRVFLLNMITANYPDCRQDFALSCFKKELQFMKSWSNMSKIFFCHLYPFPVYESKCPRK